MWTPKVCLVDLVCCVFRVAPQLLVVVEMRSTLGGGACSVPVVRRLRLCDQGLRVRRGCCSGGGHIFETIVGRLEQ